jgi:DNA-binding beta-propeller fold protein YncE
MRLAGRWLLAITVAVGLPLTAASAPTYNVTKVLVAEDQWQGEDGLIDPRPLFKPHETDASLAGFWISSNERGEEEGGEPVPSRAGITIFEIGSNKVLAKLQIEDACLPVVNPDGSHFGCAPPGAEGHPRHPHGIDIDHARRLAYQVIEHSGLRWNARRTRFLRARTTDEESGLLLVYDVRDPRKPKILAGYVLGHAAEEVAVNEANGKAYVGNHEPSPTHTPCFVSVIDRRNAKAPYRFIDLPDDSQCVQGIEANETLGQVFGTTHIGETMYAFDSANDTIAYSVDIRGPFNAFIAELPHKQQFAIPAGHVLHMHDLTTHPLLLRAYQTIHTIATPQDIEEEGEEGDVDGGETVDEITGRWVAEVDLDPKSDTFQKVRIIDLSNGQSVPNVPTHEDNPERSFAKRFVHAHFIAVDPTRHALLVTGEHTGNLAVVDTRTRRLEQVIAISRRIPGCRLQPPEDPTAPPEQAEPHVHGVNADVRSGTVYVSDEGEDCFYESVTVLRP